MNSGLELQPLSPMSLDTIVIFSNNGANCQIEFDSALIAVLLAAWLKQNSAK